MKWDENETLCWIMRWGWMTWKQRLAFNNDDGKTQYKKKTTNKSIYKKKINKNFNVLPIPPVFVGPCPCNIPWNGNQKIGAIFQLLTRSVFGNLLTDFNMALAPFRTIDNNLHWPIPCCPFHLPFLSLSFSSFPLLLLCLQTFHPPLPFLSSFAQRSVMPKTSLFFKIKWLY